MEKISLKISKSTLAAMAIALTGVSLPAVAQTEAPAAPEPAVAEATVSATDPLCRAANRSTPVFESNSTISSALQLIPPDGKVRLTFVPPAGSQFAQINLPITGFIQTAVLKSCGEPPPSQTSCRYLKQPSSVNVRSQPKIVDSPSNVIGRVYRDERVYVLLDANGNVISAQADGLNWVEIDMTKSPFFRPSGTGWLYNSVIGSNQSNLGYCF